MSNFIKKNIIEKVVELFQTKPDYRDDRWGTLKTITGALRQDMPQMDEWGMIQLAFDVDRTFRYVQQHIPSLRGKNWLLRQKMSGEISQEEYDAHISSIDDIKQVATAKGMVFQPSLFDNIKKDEVMLTVKIRPNDKTDNEIFSKIRQEIQELLGKYKTDGLIDETDVSSYTFELAPNN